MKVRYELNETTKLKEALHDTLLEFNGDLADCTVTIAANADITFKACQVSSPAQEALDEEQAAVEVNLAEFLRLLSGMVQIIDGHVSIVRHSSGAETIFDMRVVDSSFALVETDNQQLLQAFHSCIKDERRT